MSQEKMLPADMDAEVYALGAALTHPEDREHVLYHLDEMDLSNLDHRAVYRALREIDKNRWEFSKELILKVIKDKQGELTGLSELIDRLALLGRASDIRYYTKKLKQVGLQRNLILFHREGERQAWEGTKKIEQYSHKQAERLHDLIMQRSALKIWTLRDAQRDYVDGENFKEYYQKKYDDKQQGLHPLAGISTGIDGLDCSIGGWQKTRTTIVGGATGMGKSEIILQLVAKLIQQQVPVALISLEMSAQECMDRLRGIFTGIFHVKMTQFQVTEEEKERLFTQYDIWETAKQFLYIVDKPGLTTQEIKGITSMLQRKHDIKVAVVDHVLKVKTQGTNRYEGVSQVSQDLANMAKDLKLHLVLAAQLNRKFAEGQRPREPRQSDLRDSGNLEQDADNIILIHRDKDEYDRFANDEVLLKVEKARGGRSARIKMKFDPETQSMTELAAIEEEIEKIHAEQWKEFTP